VGKIEKKNHFDGKVENSPDKEDVNRLVASQRETSQVNIMKKGGGGGG
jgi:hypothetical protein